MNEELFLRFISNLLNIRICSIPANDSTPLLAFEKECCFQHALQPMYTADYLSYLLGNTKPEVFYEITDYVNTSLILFQFADAHYLAGPFIKTPFPKEEMQKLLITHKLPANILLPLKLYYNRFPLLNYKAVENSLLAAMRTFLPSTPDFSYRQLMGFHEELKKEDFLSQSSKTYAEILYQYEMENLFLSKITEGDVDGVQLAFENTVSSFYSSSDSIRQSAYATNSNGFAVFRTLIRKAAEQGGCPVVKIDELTQESIQKCSRAQTLFQMGTVQMELLLKLTQAVADAKGLQRYSPVIRNILSYIYQNYTQPVSLQELADANHVSAEHLSRTFKKETGETMSDCIARLRTQKAAELLKNTRLSVSEIAAYVGYLDSNYFVKVFKKRYGMTPSAYR